MKGDRRRFRWLYTLGGRFTICGLMAVAVICLVRIFEVWVWPEMATDLALAQMQADVAAGESLRQASALHAALPWLTAAVVMATGLVMFLPGYATRINRILDSFC